MLGSSQDSSSKIELELPRCPIGPALRELSVLGSGSVSTGHHHHHQINHRQVLRELHRRPNNNTIRFNSCYVSNVSMVGFRVRPLMTTQQQQHQVRYKPYGIVERHRTRSENNDDNNVDSNRGSESSGLMMMVNGDNRGVLASSSNNTIQHHHHHSDLEDNVMMMELVQLKKAKSLESIVAENNVGNNSRGDLVDLSKITIVNSGDISEVEVVSNSIQNLKVAEG